MNNISEIAPNTYVDNGGLHKTQAQEALSVAYVRAMCAAARVNISTLDVDNESNDITLVGQGFKGQWKRPKIIVQLKSTSNDKYLDIKNQVLNYPLSIKNYNDLRETDDLPKILVVLFSPIDNNEWIQWSALGSKLRFSGYWVSLAGKPEVSNKTNVTVKVPLKQAFHTDSLLSLLNYHSEKGISHD